MGYPRLRRAQFKPRASRARIMGPTYLARKSSDFLDRTTKYRSSFPTLKGYLWNLRVPSLIRTTQGHPARIVDVERVFVP
eukprot:4625485-Pyramimonas_sp.AAC.1